MADDQIPTEALEAATLAVHHVDCPEGELCMETMTSWGRYGRYANAAIAAAVPHLIAEGRRQAADAVRAADAMLFNGFEDSEWLEARAEVARIAEGHR